MSDSALTNGWSDMRSDYRMTTTGPNRKVRSVPSMGASADYHIRGESQYYRMVERARDMRINDPIVGKAIDRLVSLVIQDGFSPDPTSGDQAVDAEIKSRWIEWCKSPELQGEFTFNEIERLVFGSAVSDGDSFIVPTLNGDGVPVIQVIESHLCKSPRSNQTNIVLGVELGPSRQRNAYHFIEDETNPASLQFRGGTRRVSAYNSDGDPLVWQVFFPRRITQTRGVPAVQSVDDFCTYHDDIQFAQLVKQQVSCNYAILHEYDSAVPGITNPVTGTTTTYPDGSSQDVNAIYPGKEYFGRPGERLHGFSPSIPNQEYFEHISLILQIIAVNLDLPLQVLLLDPRQTNFSGWRGSIDQAKPRWRDLQRDFCARFHAPIYRWKMADFIAEDPVIRRMVVRGDVSLANPVWKKPAWPYIEPLTDTEADVLADGAGMNSRRRLLAVRGLDIEEITAERIADNESTILECKLAAQRINDAVDDDNPVTWQEVWSIPLQKGIAINWSKQEDQAGEVQNANTDQ